MRRRHSSRDGIRMSLSDGEPALRHGEDRLSVAEEHVLGGEDL